MRCETLKRTQFNELFRRWRETGDMALRNRLLESHIPLVKVMAERLQARLVDEVEVSDLEADGFFGLVYALEHFDPDRGWTFSTFAQPRIRGAMIDAIRDRDVVPRLTRDREKAVARATARFQNRHNRQPSERELKDELGLPMHKFRLLARDRAKTFNSIATELYERGANGVTTLGDTLEARPDPEPGAKGDAEFVIQTVLNEFGVNAALLLKLHHLDGLSFRQISPMFRGGMSESGMCIRHKALMKKLRRRFGVDWGNALTRVGVAA